VADIDREARPKSSESARDKADGGGQDHAAGRAEKSPYRVKEAACKLKPTGAAEPLWSMADCGDEKDAGCPWIV
jgi:hypothetical protein